MKIVLMETKDDRRKISKAYDAQIELDGTLKFPSDVCACSVTVRGDIGTLAKKNYAYIPIFSRFYFVDSFTVIANGLGVYALSVDVAKTYGEQIRQLQGHITQTTSPTQYALEKKLLDENEVKEIGFENPFNFDGENIMVCANGASNE